ncbi:hypothetical protein M7I_6669 [Glarea lozoyensis 74030]|uniref:Protein kinase domain-containing protein n=1 Tax=Glarea lozoyensis (strain ATCC 74030 / MF5533) TaxID=1104152 RepID=H0EV75_GLAL7|nr:hypothetical protein M7I_6669 [Glarea lozoyensis 74030]
MAEKVDGEDDHRLDFFILINDKSFVVTVCASLDSNDSVTQLVSRYNQAFNENGEEEIQKAQGEIEDIIYDAGWRKFVRLAPATEKNNSASVLLHSVLNPETFYFRLATDGENTDLTQEHPMKSAYGPAYFHLNISSNLPRYAAQEIQFKKKFMGLGFNARVLVNGQEMCCKIAKPGQAKAVQREYECLKKIADCEHAGIISAPALLGLVVDGGDDKVIGILEEYIPHTTSVGRCEGGIEAVTSERKAKWGKQIKRSVELLHEIEIVWGDGKPENVLVNHETDDCCLVDFGGSWTEGWVDAELSDTKEGDGQALKRILEFLAA